MSKVRGIFKRGNVYWLRYAGPNGRLIRESAKTKNLRDAEALLLKRKIEVLEGRYSTRPTRSYTFQELVKEYLTWAEGQKSFNTSKKYMLRGLVQEFGNLPLQVFGPRLIEQYLTRKLKVSKPATCNRYLACLKHTFTKAVQWEMVGKDALERVREVKFLSENNRRLRYLSSEECQALVEACSPHLRPIVITALNTGMRRGEILGLRWEQVDLKHGFILLDKTKNNERREIPINSTLRATLEATPHGPESEYVFVDRDGKPYKSVNNSFPTACKRAGIYDFHFHDLRHTFASHLVMAGVDITTVKELLGHKTLTMTLRYAHLAPSHKVNALRTLEERLTGVKKQACTAQKLTQSAGLKEGTQVVSPCENWWRIGDLNP